MWSGFIQHHGAQCMHRACELRISEARRALRQALRHGSISRNVTGLDTGRRLHGFTLLELLITVVFVAILAAIALPSYRQYVIRANRTQAKQFIGDVANRQEQYFLDQRSYTRTIGSGGLGMTPPPETSGLYSFAAAAGGNDCLGAALPAPGYTITATATGGQASDGNLCLDSVNNKTPADKWGK